MARKLKIAETVTVDVDGPVWMADWQTRPVPPEHGEFRIRSGRSAAEEAWAVSTGRASDVRVVALSCTYCQGHTETRCCEVAMCPSHAQQHQAVEHVAPNEGRYAAATEHPDVLQRRFSPPLRTIPDLPQLRDLSLRPETRPNDAVRLLELVRLTIVLPDRDDPIADAIDDLLSRGGHLPGMRRFRWTILDVLARCTWPALAEVAGEDATAQWIHDQPPVTSAKSTPLTRQIEQLSHTILPPNDEPSPAGRAAADDALTTLWPKTPPTGELSVLGWRRTAEQLLSHALLDRGGDELVGNAVARAQQRTVAILVAALAPTPRPAHDGA